MALPLSLEFCNLHVNPQNSSQLLSLPTEVIQAVGSLLDAADTICLTLSCKKATKTIGFMSWAAVSVARPNGHKRRLLTALERDLPQYHYCRYQDQLCKIPRLEPVHSADNRKSKCPARALRADKELLESAPRLPSYCDIELMWTRHVKGPPWGIPLDSAASSTAWRLRKLTHPHHGDRFFYFTKQDLVCAIADGRLYSRHTSRVWMSLREYHWLLRCENPSSLHDWIVTAPCPHVRNFRARSMLVQVAVGLTKTLTTTEENRWRATVVKTCSRCTTQHRMKAFNHGQCGVEIVQVFWNYLGDGSRESFELYNAQTRLGCSLPQKSLQHIKQLRPEHSCCRAKIQSALWSTCATSERTL